MKVGTRSLLFGVHQVLWHPITVLLAWRSLYGWPSWPEALCILWHDWGYWGKPNMDGPEGEAHPLFGGYLAGRRRRAAHGQPSRVVRHHPRPIRAAGP